jgi:hypothetical protein
MNRWIAIDRGKNIDRALKMRHERSLARNYGPARTPWNYPRYRDFQSNLVPRRSPFSGVKLERG